MSKILVLLICIKNWLIYSINYNLPKIKGKCPRYVFENYDMSALCINMTLCMGIRLSKYVKTMLNNDIYQMNNACYCNDPKFSDRYAWANSADPDQTASFGLITLW